MVMKGDLVSNWNYFKSAWKNYEVATELDKKDSPIRVATLLSIMGKDCYQIYEHLPLSTEQRKDPKVILEKIGEHFEPQRNTIFERYVFNSAMQEGSENIDQYLNRLRKLAGTCEFGVLLDEMLRDRIVIGITDNHSRARLLSSHYKRHWMYVCRSSEFASMQLQKVDASSETVHEVRGKPQNKSFNRKTSQATKVHNCKWCSNSHDKGKCPAYGQQCTKGPQARAALQLNLRRSHKSQASISCNKQT